MKKVAVSCCFSYNLRWRSKRVHEGLGLGILLERMQILFAISILSFLVLVAAGVAITRHVRQSHRRARMSAQAPSEFSEHLFRAAADRDAGLPSMVRHQSVKEIAAHKTWNTPSKLVEIAPTGEGPLFGKRKAPRPARPAAEERLDWAYFNKDYGDLTDPYQSRRIRVRPGAKSTTNGRA
jgi:hypothetical protein